MKYPLIFFLFLNLNISAQIDTTEQVYMVAEEMPTLKSCADKRGLEYLYKNFEMLIT